MGGVASCVTRVHTRGVMRGMTRVIRGTDSGGVHMGSAIHCIVRGEQGSRTGPGSHRDTSRVVHPECITGYITLKVNGWFECARHTQNTQNSEVWTRTHSA